MIGLVDPEEMKPGDLVGVNKDSYLILEKLPAEYDSRVKAMEVDARPTEEYSDIGGLDKQIEELIEAVVLPMTHKEKFENIGIHPPKGVLLYGPPGEQIWFIDFIHGHVYNLKSTGTKVITFSPRALSFSREKPCIFYLNILP